MTQKSVVGLLIMCSLFITSCDAVKQNDAVSYRRFAVVEADGKVLATEPIADDSAPLWAQNVSQRKWDWYNSPNPDAPYFKGPEVYVLPPVEGSGEPFYKHNHQPSIAWLPNGDLLAIWYTTEEEKGTELTVVASRKRAGSDRWDPCSEFFRADNRNMHGSSIFHDGKGTVYHFNGMGQDGEIGWENLALLLRTSTDNGVTWTPARPVSSGAAYQRRHQVITGTLLTQAGALIQLCDAGPGHIDGSAAHISEDGGKTWYDPGLGKAFPDFQEGAIGHGTIAGIHAGITELSDGRLMALGRDNNIDGRMPMSLSDDRGKTWTYSASPFPPIRGGQRKVLIRLQEEGVLLISFTEPSARDGRDPTRGMEFIDANGQSYTGYGMYAAVSFDDGRTWPVRKLLTPGEGDYDGGAWTRSFTATPIHAEHAGYLAATQTPDGVIHLISSRLHYQFNLQWLQTPAANIVR